MGLTRSWLEGLKLAEGVIDQVMAAHQAAVDQLRKGWEKELTEAQALKEVAQERDALKEEIGRLEKEGERADAAEKALADYKAELAAEKVRCEKEQLVRDALVRAGVSEAILPLLMTAVEMESAEVQDGVLTNEAAMVDGIRQRWAGCFTQTRAQPASGAHEKGGELLLTAEDVKLMTAEEINARWPSVQDALRYW